MTDLDARTLLDAVRRPAAPGDPGPAARRGDRRAGRPAGPDPRPRPRRLPHLPDLGGLDGAELDALIARQRDFFGARGEGVGVEAARPRRARRPGGPAGRRRLRARGAGRPSWSGRSRRWPAPPGAARGGTAARGDRPRRPGPDRRDGGGGLARRPQPAGRGLAKEIGADPQSLTVVVAEAGDEVVSAGWVRYIGAPGSRTLWGGSTLPEWRAGASTGRWWLPGAAGRARGFTLLQVDAPRTAGRSCSGSGWSRSPRPPRTSTLPDRGAG